MATTTTYKLFFNIPVFNRNVSINELKLGSPFLIQFMTNSFLCHSVSSIERGHILPPDYPAYRYFFRGRGCRWNEDGTMSGVWITLLSFLFKRWRCIVKKDLSEITWKLRSQGWLITTYFRKPIELEGETLARDHLIFH